MKQTLTSLLFILLIIPAIAQKEAVNWHFGSGIAVHFDEECMPGTSAQSSIGAMEAAATISDRRTGELLFYSDALLVWNRDHQRMPHSGDDNPTLAANRKYRPLSQGSLIVPMPGDSLSYYLFSLFQSDSSLRKPPGVLSYSQVDMRLEGGMGDVVIGTKNTFLRDGLAGRLTAVRHSNGRDYWLLTREARTNTFFVYPITVSGIGTPHSINIGSVQHEMSGYLKASPDGTRLACTFLGNTHTQVDLYNFDASTGNISNFTPLGMLKSNYGLSFSPDNTKLYVGSNNTSEIVNGKHYHEIVRQYDLNAADIAASGKSIIYNNPFTNYQQHEIAGEHFWSPPMQIGPDGRIYIIPNANQISCPTCDFRVLVINKPNESGFACDVSVKTFISGNAGNGNLCDPPNFMQHYFNGLVSADCVSDEPCNDADFILAPNPAKDDIEIVIKNGCNNRFDLRLINLSGQVIRSFPAQTGSSRQIKLAGLAAGVYLVEVRFVNKSVSRRFVKL